MSVMEYLRPRPGLGVEEANMLPQRAIWIASYPKSENTWIRVFLHNLTHQLRGEENHCQDINALREVTERETMIDGFSEALGKPVAEATPAEIAAVRCAVQARLVQGKGGPVFIKTHNAVATVEGAPAINLVTDMVRSL